MLSLDAAQQSPTVSATNLADYRPPDFLVDTVDLEFRLDPARTVVRARLALRRRPGAAPDAPLALDGEALELLALACDGIALSPAAYTLLPEGLRLLGLPDACTLEITTAIAPERNTELSGLYVSGGAFFTQCEAEGFRRITYFPDRPDVMARFTATLIADRARYPVLLANGNPAARGEGADGTHWARWEDPHPKPCYLFALVAGDLLAVRDRFTTRSGRAVALAIWVRRGDEDRCAHAMRSLQAAMAWDETVFGLEYDLDVFNIAAVSDFNMGAMENKGLNIFNTKYVLARPDTATDADYQGIESVIAHEYFHNWTGNRVTCRDWFQLSLKEGLTVFRDQEFSADQGSRAVKRIADVRALRAGQFPEDAGPLAHPVRPERYLKIDNFYTATIYQKGAEVVRMIHTLLGAAAFRRGMDLYFARHDNQAVTIEDFCRAMQDASGVDLTGFARWYEQAGTPEISLSDAYDPARRRYTLTLRQHTAPTPGQPEKQALLIPIALGLLDGKGDAMPMRLAGESRAQAGTRVLQLATDEQSFVFEDVAEAPTPSLPRGFSAPVRLAGVPAARLAFLAAHDTDPFVRWDSAQQYATGVMLEMAAAWRRGAALALDDGLRTIVAAALEAGAADPAFAAEVLRLPGESTLAEAMEIVDVEAIHAAHHFTRAALGRALAPAWRQCYATLADPGPYRIDGAAIGRRALRNTALAYLLAGDASLAPLAKAQVDAGANMTDVLAALAALAPLACAEREATLAAFHARWREDALVLDKWFALQAMASRPDALAQVEALAEHADFDWRNPNRLRALVASFASGNPAGFHDASGGGYRFLADAVLRVDAGNAQLAARLVAPLGRWRRFDAARAALMQAQLQRILAQPGLSRNAFEIVSKSLQ